MSETELRQIQEKIEARLRERQPDVELLTLERPASERLLLVIDREDGVDLALCESVTRLLRDLNEDWALEVSSPGPERPLTKPEHFERFLGSRIRVRTIEPFEGQKSFTGRLTAADEDTVSVDSGDGPVAIPRAVIRRSNLLSDASEAGERPAEPMAARPEHANGGVS